MKVRHKRHLMMKARGGGVSEPSLVSGNPKVVSAAKETKSLGKVPGIFAKGRLDKRARGGKVNAPAAPAGDAD